MSVEAKFDCPSELVDKLLAQYNQLCADAVALKDKYNALVTLVNELKADLSEHTHGGVAAGSDTSGAAPTISAADAQTATVSAEQVAKI